MDAKKILLTIFMLFAINELFSQGWDIQTGTWLSPNSDTKNFGVKKSFQVTDTLKVRGNFGVGTLNPVARVHFRLGSGGFSTFGLVGDSSVQFSTYDSTTDVRYLFSINGYSDIFSIARDSTGAAGDHDISINASGVLINGLSPFQNLSISNDTLSIDNGNSVVLPGGGADTSLFNLSTDTVSPKNEYLINAYNLAVQDNVVIHTKQTTTGLTANTAGYMMVYNGRNATTDQQIGLAYHHNNGGFFTKSIRNPILRIGAGGSFDDGHLAQPCLLYVNGTYYIYYSAWDGSNYRCALATSPDAITWTKIGVVLDLGSGGAWDDAWVYTPHVIYDPDDADATRRWKMWYSGNDGTNTQIGYAYSASPTSGWTKYGSNPVILRGGAGAFDETYAYMPTFYKDEDGTSWIIYEGYPSAGFPNSSQIGVASFTNPESTYTKFAGNPVLSNRSTATQSLTANTLTGSATVTVANTAVFEPNEYVLLNDGTPSEQLTRIISINSGTGLTISPAATADFTTAASATIKSIYLNKVAPKSVLVEDGRLAIYGTAYGMLPASQREVAAKFTATNPTTGWEIDFDAGVQLPIVTGSSTAWDYTSAENPSVIPSHQPEELYLLQKAAQVDVANTFTANQRINATLAVNGAPWTWSGVSAMQAGTDLTMWDFGNGLANVSSNLMWNGSAYIYLNSRAAATIAIGHSPGGVAGSIGFGFAPSGTANNTATVTVPVGITNTGNVLIGQSTATMTVGTSAVGTLIMKIATAPGSSPVDQFHMYAADGNGAGTACPHFRTEEGHIIELRQQANIPDADSSNIVSKFNSLLQYMENLGFIAP